VRCSSCELLLDAYLESALRPRQTHAVAAHLRVCEGCAALLRELRVVDALLSTARGPGVDPNFTAAVVSATHASQPQRLRRTPLWLALSIYLAIAWALAAIAVLRSNDVIVLLARLWMLGERDVAALAAAARALAPATPLAAATVTGVLLFDALLLYAILHGYRRMRPFIALYLGREPRS
jgi:anti-sigma factor RsiW